MKILIQFYRIITSIVAVVAILCLVKCGQPTKAEEDEPVWNSSAQLGWYGNRAVVNVVDYRGEQFMMQYKLYRWLFIQGGYNTILRFYYEHPYDERLYIVDKTFQVSRAKDAVELSAKFDSSYSKIRKADTPYRPTAQIISKSISVRKQRYRDSYNPSTAKPTL